MRFPIVHVDAVCLERPWLSNPAHGRGSYVAVIRASTLGTLTSGVRES